MPPSPRRLLGIALWLVVASSALAADADDAADEAVDVPIPTLVEQLLSDDAGVRGRARYNTEAMGERAAGVIEPLAAAYDNADRERRLTILEALRSVAAFDRQDIVLPLAIGLLRAGEAYERTGALQVLARLDTEGITRATPALLAALGDVQERARMQAMELLAKLRPPPEGLESRLWAIVEEGGGPADPNGRVALHASHFLPKVGEFSPEVGERLVALYRSPSLVEAAERFAKFDAATPRPSAMPAVSPADHPGVTLDMSPPERLHARRVMALQMLWKLTYGPNVHADPPTIALLIEVVRGEEDAELLGGAMGALTSSGEAAAAAQPAVLTLAKESEDEKIRRQALITFARINPKGRSREAVTSLMEFLDDSDPRVRSTAVEDLARFQLTDDVVDRLTARVMPLLGDEADNVRRGAAAVLGRLGERAEAAIPTLRRMVTDDSAADVRVNAVQALQALGEPARAALPEVVRATRDPDKRVRWVSLHALPVLGADEAGGEEGGFDAAAVAAAEAGLGDDEPWVRDAAAAALAEMGQRSERATAWLASRLGDADRGTRQGALRGLPRVAPDPHRAVEIIAPHLSDPTPGSRFDAASALKEVGEASLPALRAALHAESDPWVRGQMERSIAAIEAEPDRVPTPE